MVVFEQHVVRVIRKEEDAKHIKMEKGICLKRSPQET